MLFYGVWVLKRKVHIFFGNSFFILFICTLYFRILQVRELNKLLHPSSPRLSVHLRSNQCSLKNHQLLLVCSLSPFSIGPHPGAFGHGTVPWHWSLGECTPCWMLSNGSEWSLMSLKMQCSVWCCSPGKMTICAPEDRRQAYVYTYLPHTHTHGQHLHILTRTENQKHTFNWLFAASAHYCPFSEKIWNVVSHGSIRVFCVFKEWCVCVCWCLC